MPRQWIITAAGDYAEVDCALVKFVLGKMELFCLTETDKRFIAGKMAKGDTDIEEALLSRVLLVGTAQECRLISEPPESHESRPQAPSRRAGRGWKLIGSPSPPLPLKPGEDVRNRDLPTILIELVNDKELMVVFHRESEPFWERLRRWLETVPVETGVHPHMVIAFKEWATQRAWCMSVESVTKYGFQYSEDPAKGARCNRCGAQISWEEIIFSRVCGQCGMELS